MRSLSNPDLVELLSSREPLALATDVYELARFEPEAVAHVEDAGAYTERLLDESRELAPTRRRECSMGYHATCSDAMGDDGCGCDCHPLLTRLYHDNPVLERVRSANEQTGSCYSDRGLASGWCLAMDLLELDLELSVQDDAEAFEPGDQLGVLSEKIWGEDEADGHAHVTEVLEALAQNGVKVSGTRQNGSTSS